MPIESVNTEKNPEHWTNPSEKNKRFSDGEQKLIDEYSKNKANAPINLSNMEAETKKTWWEAHRSLFFEKNYKSISKDPQKYPTLYPLLQTFLVNNKQAVNDTFTKNFNGMKWKLAPNEITFGQDIYNSPAMQSWLNKNPEKNGRIAWDQFNELFCNKILERIDQWDRKNFSSYPDIVKWVVDELFYAAENDIQKSQVTDKTEKMLSSVHILLSTISEQNPELYAQFKSIHTTIKDYLNTIKNEKTIMDIKSNVNIKVYDKVLENFVTISKQKTEDPSVLQEAVNIIQPVLQTLYDQWLSDYTKAKENKDPLEKITTFMNAQTTLKKLTALKKESGFNFSKFEWTYSNNQTDINISLAQDLIDDINTILRDDNIIPALYDAWYKLYQDAILEKDPDQKKEKYETCKLYFEKITEKKQEEKNYSQRARNIFTDSENKLQNINNYLWGKWGITIERVDVSALPVYWWPSPFPRNWNEPFHLYVGENKQQFDTIEIFDVRGRRVANYENGKDIFPLPDTWSKYAEREWTNPIQFDLPLQQRSLSAGVYIFRLSSKATQITKSEKFEIL